MSAIPAYTLKHPITVVFNKGKDDEREEQILEVTLRRLKGRDLRATDACPGQASMVLLLISKATGLTQAQADDLDLEDVTALGDLVAGFMPPGLLTGKTPSET